MQERQVRASLCRLEQGVGGKKCGSGKQYRRFTQGACKSANRGTVTKRKQRYRDPDPWRDQRGRTMSSSLGSVTRILRRYVCKSQVYFGTDGRINEGM